MGTVLPGMGQGNTLLQVGPGWDKLAKIEQGISQGPAPLQEERRVVLTLCQGEELLGQLTSGPQIPPYLIKSPEAKQHRTDLTGISQLLAQSPSWLTATPPGRVAASVRAGHARMCTGRSARTVSAWRKCPIASIWAERPAARSPARCQ
jgi:hypothetical protein